VNRKKRRIYQVFLKYSSRKTKNSGVSSTEGWPLKKVLFYLSFSDSQLSQNLPGFTPRAGSIPASGKKTQC
jgi:hypothetical protein